MSALRSLSKDCRGERNGTFSTGLVFLEWLQRNGQTAWQLCPLAQTPLQPGSRTIHAPSPYQGFGVGLDPKYLGKPWRNAVPSPAERQTFLRKNRAWISDYALFCALRDHFGTDRWAEWPREIRLRHDAALRIWSERLRPQIQAHVDMQWRLHASFNELVRRAKTGGIAIIGDVPFYVPMQSPLVWARQEAFDLSPDGRPRRVSGIPMGPKSHFGRQVWNQPLYRWDAPKRRRAAMALWRLRLTYASQLYDIVRLDHAKGFYLFGAMDPERPERDEVRPGPGSKALEPLIRHCRNIGLQLYAEDAGDRVRDLRATLRFHRIAGIRLLRFAYNERRKSIEKNYADIARYPYNTFAMTSTHDTCTLMGYLRLLTTPEKRILAQSTGVKYDAKNKTFARRLRAAVLASRARNVIFPLQDWLLTEDRINVPGTERLVRDPNWRFRMRVPIERLNIVGL